MIERLLSFLRAPPRDPEYLLFKDSQGNFTVPYPSGWRYDEDMAIVDGKYTLCFESPDGSAHFTIALEGKVSSSFDLPAWAKENLGSPRSGFIADVRRTASRWGDSYSYSCKLGESGSGAFFSGIAFIGKGNLFSLSWGSSGKHPKRMRAVLDHMERGFELL